MRIIRALLLLFSAPAAAEVVDVGASGMEIRHTVKIAAPPVKVWAALIVPGTWWNSDHTFSGSAANMTLEPKAGGCWCESLANGGAHVHMTVGHLAPPTALTLRGSLGPLFTLAADGAMHWALAANGAETDVTLTFRAGGYIREGFQKWAGPVDGVLGLQVANLKNRVEAVK